VGGDPALALSVASQVGPHFELQRVVVAVLLLVYLVVFRRRFSAQSDPRPCAGPWSWPPRWPS
jgi:hypothetical protein